LRGSAHGQAFGWNIARYRGSGTNGSAIADRHRRHQLGIGADKHPVTNAGQVLGVAIVIAGDGPGTDVDRAPDLGITDITQVVDLAAFANSRFLGLDEVAHLGAVANSGLWPQSCKRPDAAVGPDLGGLDDAVRLDRAAGPDQRISQHAVRANPHPVTQHHCALEDHADIDEHIASDLDLAAQVETGRVGQGHSLIQ